MFNILGLAYFSLDKKVSDEKKNVRMSFVNTPHVLRIVTRKCNYDREEHQVILLIIKVTCKIDCKIFFFIFPLLILLLILNLLAVV